MSLADHADRWAASARHDIRLPRRQRYRPSPASWRDEVIYFLLVDRFSDGREADRPLVDRRHPAAARPAVGGQPWRWDRWWTSGRDRWQGGTIAGVATKLDYLCDLGVTAIWLSPVFKQRAHLDTFHGYGIQDFLDVDPRFGTRQDLVDLVAAAHDRDLRVVLDVIFNHSGANWVYPDGQYRLPYTTGRYDFGSWLGRHGDEVDAVTTPDEGAWPVELQDPDAYTRAGSADLGEGTDIADPWAEHKRGDFEVLRDFDLSRPGVLADLARCFQYWIALTGCDGFRIDTVKHVSFQDARDFCGAIKEFALNVGIADFLLLARWRAATATPVATWRWWARTSTPPSTSARPAPP
jgi:glycosidase